MGTGRFGGAATLVPVPSPAPRGEGLTGAGIDALLREIAAERDLRDEVAHRALLPARPGDLAECAAPAWTALRGAPALGGIEHLFSHQARALELLASGRDVVLATGTASGKSLVYQVPALAEAIATPDAHALLLFPLRALEQDQEQRLRAAADALGLAAGGRRAVAIYDGDTPPGERKRLREAPPAVLVTTPDMLHAGILPSHASWAPFFRGLRLVVVDELHSYRGIFGSHVAQVLRRLDRIAAHHGARPRLVAASATVANPGELGARLTGREPGLVERDGAPRPARHVLLLRPRGSANTTAARLFRLSVRAGLRTIAFTKARAVAELLYTWVAESDPALRERITPYRAGYLASERREIERSLFEGRLLGVVSTSALELGIDVGDLDVCILVGYPGSQIASWQRAGRVGRTRTGLLALVAGADALDQYLVAHPERFLGGRFEHAVLDPANPEIAAPHLACAAAELPLRAGEPWLAEPGVEACLRAAEARGSLYRSESGREWFAARRRPHREVDLRAAGASCAILLEQGGGGRAREIGTIGVGRVFAECHEGAIYLHRGRQFLVTELDLERRSVRVRAVDVPFYTRAISEKETEVLSRERARPVGNFRLVQGRVRVTTRFTGYERRRVHGQDLLATEPLELPPTSFETTSLWLEMPHELKRAVEEAGGHFMGGIHAMEHAALALCPLFALCDRHDVAGISYALHPQLGKPAVFLYDAHPGGAGLAPGLFGRVEALLEATLELVAGCECEEGCPACVHSPKCGSGNRPIDKRATVATLELLLARAPLPLGEEPPARPPPPVLAPAPPPASAPDVVFFDLETQRAALEVGGWHNAHLMRVAVAVLYEARAERFLRFREADVEALLARLRAADLVVGFNVRRFDYCVLRGYTDADLDALPTFDLLDEIHARLGFRLSLSHLGEETLARPKTADGLQALRWWREGRVEEIETYCRADVALLRDLVRHAQEREHLLFRTKQGERVRIPLRLRVDELVEAARARREGAPRPQRVPGAFAAV
ncbi:MAG TPA: DEAD/DEAH box helicase [Myxococcota bacterium]|nr:DEAD/DEAH box helicase [Myxococcota bacterium]